VNIPLPFHFERLRAHGSHPRMRWRALAFGALGLLAGLGLRVDAASRDPWTSNHVIGSPLPPPPYTVRRLFPTVRFEHPVDLALVPGTDQRYGLITFDNDGRERNDDPDCGVLLVSSVASATSPVAGAPASIHLRMKSTWPCGSACDPTGITFP